MMWPGHLVFTFDKPRTSFPKFLEVVFHQQGADLSAGRTVRTRELSDDSRSSVSKCSFFDWCGATGTNVAYQFAPSVLKISTCYRYCKA